MGRRSMAVWISRLAIVAFLLASFAVALEICRVGRPISPWSAETAAIAALGFAGVVAGVSRKALIALEARVEF